MCCLSSRASYADESVHLQFNRVRDLEGEHASILETLQVVAATLRVQGSQNVPSSQDPVWANTGPLGGVQYMLDLSHRHMRVRRAGAGVCAKSGWLGRCLILHCFPTSGITGAQPA